jgi:serine/threonine protein kinase/formylglycine-generating enzyme required for sulfatase activity
MDESGTQPETQDWRAFSADSSVASSLPHPPKLGRYSIIGVLGKGGFGHVLLAYDDDLDRAVAIKIPNPERITRPEDVEAFLGEARILARLDHPQIVPVFDVGRTDDGVHFIVSKFIEGSSLRARMQRSRPSFGESAQLVGLVAEALHYAHARGLVHRDIKPENILIDAEGKPYVVDFGLALKDEDFGTGAGFAGTLAYMSPEQARGEGHRVDGRSDTFSLGVVLYELLTGQRPFQGDSHEAIRDQIISCEPPPPRQIDARISRELERICVKALSKRSLERYSTAREMAEDLRLFPATAGAAALPLASADSASTPPESTREISSLAAASRPADSDPRPIRIVPKGLRSFDQRDAGFFLQLLPGPRDREGLPESVRFWKERIEAIDPDETFKVGLIYGPSGCGKSSLVKAGLLPRLAQHVLPAYVEATPDATETRLLKAVRKACRELSPNLGLIGWLAELRRGRVLRPGKKVLLVLDQFEQWLFARRNESDTVLVSALRQCDGEHLQAIVLVRDDFWMAATRFMRDLEIRLVEGENAAAVDLFDPPHARQVLAAFGRAFGALPERQADLTRDQQAFLDQAIAALSQEGKVISVRLALVSEMIKGKAWTPATLREVGGTEGVGVTFLEETFSASQANPRHRLHQKAAQAVLKALLPETGTDIKGQMRPEAELRAVSGYGSRPQDFDDLIHILDPELRLITPTDPEGSTGAEQPARPGAARYYQLTHDYLVHPLREWLTRKQKETRRGRAEVRLAERAALWTARPENRHLPSLPEWLNIRLWTRKNDWAGNERRMMRRAGRVHGMRALGLTVLIALLSWAGIDGYGNLRAAALVDAIARVGTGEVPRLVDQMQSYRRWANPRLVRLARQSGIESREHLHASLALLPVDPGQVDYLYNRLLHAGPAELPVIRDAIEPYRGKLGPRLWGVLKNPQADPDQRFAAACALAGYDPAGSRAEWDAAAGFITDRLLASVLNNPSHYPPLIALLRPVRQRLVAPLSAVFRDRNRAESERSLATNVLADYAGDQPGVLADVLMDAEEKPFAVLFERLRPHPRAVTLLEAELAKKPAPGVDDDSLAQRQARAAVALVRLGRAERVWPLLRHSPDPSVRSSIVNWLKPLGADPTTVATTPWLRRTTAEESLAGAPSRMDAILFHPETSVRRALILALGQYDAQALSPGDCEALVATLVDAYRHDPDAGIHGAAEWTLRRWKQGETIQSVTLPRFADRGNRRWYANSAGQTFAVIEGPVLFGMGSPLSDPERFDPETPHRRRINRRFAIATKEVTVDQYQRFLKENSKIRQLKTDNYSPEPGGPMNRPSWYEAAAYCNWLSRQESLEECYAPNPDGAYAEGMKCVDGFLNRSGYRLPTEAEWEYACRAGTLTSRYYGSSVALLGHYAWYVQNSRERAWPCGQLQPNDLGLFDMLGNLYEWCQDQYGQYPIGGGAQYIDDINISHHITDKDNRPIRGGTFAGQAVIIRAAYRTVLAPASRITRGGFRPARTLP